MENYNDNNDNSNSNNNGSISVSGKLPTNTPPQLNNSQLTTS